MPSLQFIPAMLWENIEDRNLLCEVLQDKSQKLFKKNIDQVGLQK